MLFSNEVVMFMLCVPVQASRRISLLPTFAALAFFIAAPVTRSQDQTKQDQTQQSQQQSGAQQQQQQAPDIGPAAGGPNGSTGAIAVPKKQPADTEPAPPAPPPPEFKNPPGTPNFSIQLQAPEVVMDVGVLLQKTGQFVPGLKPDNFRVYENGVEQKVIGFKRVQAPITALLLCEFASRGYFTFSFNVDMLNTAWAFAQQLRPQDYVAMMTFDLNPHIILDFTQNKQEVQQAINSLASEAYMPTAFQETNVFDALYNALDRLSRIQGEKYIILVASGVDSFSKLDFDQIYKRVKDARNVTIFSISTGGLLRAETEGGAGVSAAMRDMKYLQADNEMRTFATATGGRSYFPRFLGELPEDVSAINEMIRSKYELVYQPTDTKQDGSYRKFRVELVDNEGKPLRMQDQKHKPLKYELIYRDGYLAQPAVE